MEEEKQETCSNCKREIPSVNFQIHVVHCERNIKMCPVCKEPVLNTDLEKHHEKMHKPLPCKKCGESVCGTDLEDHIRDSCAQTVKTCRFCELELPRHELPTHEGYCGVRTEQCSDCKEWVMIKYRQVHLESNHGFLRLDDDPVPVPPRSNVPRPVALSVDSVRLLATHTRASRDARRIDKSNKTKQRNGEDSATSGANGHHSGLSNGEPVPSASSSTNHNVIIQSGNEPPASCTGAVKKRPAPKPPAAKNPQPVRDFPYYSAMQRKQYEDRQRDELTAQNLARGLPPVLNPAEKLERLRKMDALMNPEEAFAERIARKPPPDQNSPKTPENTTKTPTQRYLDLTPMTQEEFQNRFDSLQMGADRFSEIKSSLRELRRGLNEVTAPYNANAINANAINANPVNANAINANAVNANASNANRSPMDRVENSRDPWEPDRVSPGRLGPDPVSPGRLGPDRVSPGRSVPDRVAPAPPPVEGGFHEPEVSLPCEFCAELVPAEDLVRHQTGCRPDLTQYRPEVVASLPIGAPSPRPPSPPRPDGPPLIPCEFCFERLPVYLIINHQENCPKRDDYRSIDTVD